jgi:FAD:protein FMN transferase
VSAWRAMGCDVVVAGATPAELGAVRALLAEREARFSRFRADSELARVNASSARALHVSEPFARALATALAVAERTGGRLDPTLGAALEAAGYDRDLAELDEDPRPPGPAVPGRRGEVQLAGRLLTRPPGLRLDLNGVVKAMAVDDALGCLAGDGWVSVGGDLAARGPVDVALPGGGAIRLVAGALATSSTAVRRWRRGGAWQHHLIDPATGRPAISPWVTVTACGATCLAADTAARAALLLGEAGPRWLEGLGIPARLVDADGGVTVTAAWSQATAEAAAACT